jgi:hypothetical protein
MPLLCERQQKFKLVDQGDGPRNVMAKAVARWPEIARTGGHQYVKSGVRRARFQGQSGSRIASFHGLISDSATGLPG